MAAYRKAVGSDAKNALAWINLGNVQYEEQKKLDEAVVAYKKALAIDAKNALAWYGLGNVLRMQKKLATAVAAYNKALASDEKFAEAHCNLGFALRAQGNLVAALQSFEVGHQLGSKRADWPYPSAQWVQQCRELVALEQQLPAVLNGEKSGPVEQLQLAALCQRYLKRYADAAQLYAAALATLPPTAKELRYPKRYNAACAATLAAAGKGKAADKQARAKLRQQAFEWLQAETSAHAKLLDGTPQSAAVIQDRLQHWQQNPDLNSICADEELKKLPEPERHKWHKLWSEVATLQKQARDSYDEKKITGQLTPAKTTHNHKLQLSTTKVYVIEMHSKQFNTLLRLEDAGGKSLAENDDISKQKGILDSRITFAPTKTGTYHLIADSFQPRGCGNYEIIIREFSASGKTTTVETPTKQNKGNKPPALTRPRQAAK